MKILFLFVVLVIAQANATKNDLTDLKNILTRLRWSMEKSNMPSLTPKNEVFCGCDVSNLEMCQQETTHENVVDSIVKDSAATLLNYVRAMFKPEETKQKSWMPKDATECLKQRQMLTCGNDEQIKIISATMSNKNLKQCPIKSTFISKPNIDECYESYETTNLVEELCNGKENCVFSIDQEFSKICKCKAQKYLDLTYTCVPMKELERSDRSKRALQYYFTPSEGSAEYEGSKKGEYESSRKRRGYKGSRRRYSEGSRKREYESAKREYGSSRKRYEGSKRRRGYEGSRKRGYEGSRKRGYESASREYGAKRNYESRESYGIPNYEVTGRHHESMLHEVSREEGRESSREGGYKGKRYNREGGRRRYRNREGDRESYEGDREGREGREGGRRRFLPFYDYLYGDYLYGDYLYGDYLYDDYLYGDYMYGGYYPGDYLDYAYGLAYTGWGGWGDLYDYVTENYISKREGSGKYKAHESSKKYNSNYESKKYDRESNYESRNYENDRESNYESRNYENDRESNYESSYENRNYETRKYEGHESNYESKRNYEQAAESYPSKSIYNNNNGETNSESSGAEPGSGTEDN